MLQARKKRQPFFRKPRVEVTTLTLMVSFEENPSPSTGYEISVLNSNEAGMGITSSVPLTVGQSIFFNGKPPEGDLPKSGIVKWAFQDHDGFRAGIKFA